MKKYVVALALLVSCHAAPAFAEVITFDGATIAQDNSVTVGSYKFTFAYGQTPVLFTTNDGHVGFGDNLESRSSGSVFILSRLDGGIFTIDSGVFAMAGQRDPYAFTFRVNGTEVLDGQSFIGPANITSYVFDTVTTNGAVGLRSLSVSSPLDVGAVPEPATWVMMLFGFGAVGYSMRRKRTRVRVTYA